MPVGVDLATLADLPRDVILEAKRVTALLTDLHTQQEVNSQAAVRATHRRAVVKVRHAFCTALEYRRWTS